MTPTVQKFVSCVQYVKQKEGDLRCFPTKIGGKRACINYVDKRGGGVTQMSIILDTYVQLVNKGGQKYSKSYERSSWMLLKA